MYRSGIHEVTELRAEIEALKKALAETIKDRDTSYEERAKLMSQVATLDHKLHAKKTKK